MGALWVIVSIFVEWRGAKDCPCLPFSAAEEVADTLQHIVVNNRINLRKIRIFAEKDDATLSRVWSLIALEGVLQWPGRAGRT
jgi:hypothetical protein